MTEENDRGFSEFVGWCDRSIVSGTHDRKFIEILAKEDMARIYSYIKEGAEQEAFKRGWQDGWDSARTVALNVLDNK